MQCVIKSNYSSAEWLFEVRVGQFFEGFTYQTNPLVISIFFQDRGGVCFLGERDFLNWGDLFTQKNLKRRLSFWKKNLRLIL